LARAKDPQMFIDKFRKKAFGRSQTKAEGKKVCVFVAKKKSECLTSGMNYLREIIKSRASVKKKCRIKF